jgi:phosphatidylinositol alpha-mannosyltransferase
MRIALVSPYDWLTPGGVNRHVEQLAAHLVELGHYVRIIAPASGAVADPRVIVAGYPVPIPAAGSHARISLDPRLGRRVRLILEDEQFDVVHIHEPLMPTLPIQVLRNSRKANPDVVNVGTFHARKDGGNRLYGYGRLLLKRWFREIDGKIAVSPPAAQYVERYFPGYYNVIPNGVDIERWDSPTLEPLPEFDDGNINILYVGRAEKRKGLPYLIRAFGIVNARDPHTRLIVAGADSRRWRRYRDSIEGERRNVVFRGGVPDADLPRYHRTAHIFCSPATGHESQGIVLLEAMAAHLPVVATNIEGYASVLTDHIEGILVPPKDVIALADALTALVRDQRMRTRMGAAGRLRAEHYSWPRITMRLLAYYARLRDARGAASRARTREQASAWHA